jgi:hypothetical protein
MDLSAEAIKAIQDKAKEAEALTKAVTILDIPGDNRRKLLVQSGKHEFIDVPPALRNHHVETLMDLTEYAKTLGGNFTMWHNLNGVVLIIDDGDRRDRVTFNLVPSAAAARLAKIDEGASFTQKDFIKLLRNEFRCTEPQVAIFRKINFKLIQSAEGEIARGKESMGRSIEQQVKTGVDALPEDIVVSIPLYNNAGETATYDVRLLLDYDASTARILVEIEADSWQAVRDDHQADIKDRLAAGLDDAAIYYGCP